jgi:K+ potassium transporter integral membrane domain
MEHDLGRLKRKPVKATGVALALMVYQTWGVIYSDIGTSPLYVLNGIWPSSGPLPSKDDVIGGLSAIIWSLTILPLIKYASDSSWPPIPLPKEISTSVSSASGLERARVSFSFARDFFFHIRCHTIFGR